LHRIAKESQEFQIHFLFSKNNKYSYKEKKKKKKKKKKMKKGRKEVNKEGRRRVPA